MKKIILWMLFFTGFIYAIMGLQKHSKQDRLKKEDKIQNTIDSLQNIIDSLQLQQDIQVFLRILFEQNNIEIHYHLYFFWSETSTLIMILKF